MKPYSAIPTVKRRIPSTKVCPICKKRKPLTEFYFERKSLRTHEKEYRRRRCKICHNIRRKQQALLRKL